MSLELLQLLTERLQASGIPSVADVALEGGQHLLTFDRRLALTASVRDQSPGRVHAHVVSWLASKEAPDGRDALDACLMGFGTTVGDAMAQVADMWLHLVGSAVLSCLAARPFLDADHFDGQEEWGVPGGHGFVGPFAIRGNGDELDGEALARSPAFQLEGYPKDGRPHLAKVTLFGRDGRWERHVEIDGHARRFVDEDWKGLPGPAPMAACVRFAVFVLH